jgi:hypothetical protein
MSVRVTFSREDLQEEVQAEAERLSEWRRGTM